MSAWLSGWTYRHAIVVDNTAATVHLDMFQLSLTLTSSNITWANAKSDLSDLRFTKNDGTTLLKHALEWKNGTTAAYVLVQLMGVKAGVSDSIYMYYGNAGASSVSDFAGTVNSAPSAPTTSTALETAPQGYAETNSSCQANNGDYLIVYSNQNVKDAQSVNTTCRLCRSTDHSTWAFSNVSCTGVPAYAIPGGDSMSVLANNDIFLVLEDSTVTPNVGYVIKSTDNGSTWTKQATLANPFSGAGTSRNNFYGPVVEDGAGGNLYLTSYGLNNGDARTVTIVWKSTDGGATWAIFGGTIANATIMSSGSLSFNEASLCRIDANNWYIVARTSGNVSYSKSTTGMSAMSNFSAPANLPLLSLTNTVPTDVSPTLRKLANGHLLLGLADRTNFRIYGSISRDNGAHFEYKTNLASTTGADSGNPTFTLLSDNLTILASHYDNDLAGPAGKAFWYTFTEAYLLQEMYDDFEGGIGGWTTITGVPVSDTVNVLNGTKNMKLARQGGGANSDVGRSLANVNSGKTTCARWKGAFSTWCYPTLLSSTGTFGFVLSPSASVETLIFRVSAFSGSPYALKYYDGAANQVFTPGASITPSAQNKFTIVHDQTAGTAKAYVNNAVLNNNATFPKATASSNNCHAVCLNGGQGGVNNAETMWIDDTYGHQWTDVLPTITYGGEDDLNCLAYLPKPYLFEEEFEEIYY